MYVIAWNENETGKLEVRQNRVTRMAGNASRYTAVGALRGDTGWSTFRERLVKTTRRYKIRLKGMDDEGIARKVYLWNESGSKMEEEKHENDRDEWVTSGVGDEDGWEEPR